MSILNLTTLRKYSLGLVLLKLIICLILKYVNRIFGPDVMKFHKSVMTENVNRDKNHPSVIMWSLANEPQNNVNLSVSYFQ